MRNLVLIPEMAAARAEGRKDVTRRVTCAYEAGDVVYHGEVLCPQEYGRYACYFRDGRPVKPHTDWRWTVQKLSSRFCPQACARLFSMVRSTRLEGLCDITEDDAVREGVQPLDAIDCPCEDPDVEDPGPTHKAGCRWSTDVDPDEYPHLAAFAVLWNRLHPKSPWSAGVAVFRIELGPRLTRAEAERLAAIKDPVERFAAAGRST